MKAATEESKTGSMPSSADGTVDLAALGSTYKPAQLADASPEVAEVLAKMPWWAARGLIFVVTGFVVVALLWAALTPYDVVVAAPGVLVPVGDVIRVQAAQAGLVESVLARDGDNVHQGDPLLRLDDGEARTRLAKLQDQLSVSQEQLMEARAGELPESQTQDKETAVAALQSEVASAEQVVEHCTITAPADGVIGALEGHGIGSVLSAGDNVATLVPANVPLVVDARVANKDVAFLVPGLPAKLKFDAFPYQDYGTISGVVQTVGPEADAASGTNTASGEFTFPITIVPAQTTILARGNPVFLRAGLTVTAEVVTERKRVLSLLLEPITKLRGDRGG